MIFDGAIRYSRAVRASRPGFCLNDGLDVLMMKMRFVRLDIPRSSEKNLQCNSIRHPFANVYY